MCQLDSAHRCAVLRSAPQWPAAQRMIRTDSRAFDFKSEWVDRPPPPHAAGPPPPNTLPEAAQATPTRAYSLSTSKIPGTLKPYTRIVCQHIDITTQEFYSSISAAVPMRGVKVISPHRPDDQRATMYDSLLLAHVWTNCTGADKCYLARSVRTCLNVVGMELCCDDRIFSKAAQRARHRFPSDVGVDGCHGACGRKPSQDDRGVIRSVWR